MSDKDTTTTKTPKEEAAVAKKEEEEEAADTDTEKDPSSPFSEDEIKRIEVLLKEQFEREKEEAQFEGRIQCLWTGRYVCFCRCGPHLCCPEHSLNCMMGGWDGGEANIPEGVDPLLKRWILWQHRDFA